MPRPRRRTRKRLQAKLTPGQRMFFRGEIPPQDDNSPEWQEHLGLEYFTPKAEMARLLELALAEGIKPPAELLRRFPCLKVPTC